MKLEVDAARCEGHALCLQAAPLVLHHDDNAEVIIDMPVLTGEALEQARLAVRLCPVGALRLVDGE